MHRRLVTSSAVLALSILVQGSPSPAVAEAAPPPLPVAAREALRAARAGQTVTLPAGVWSGPLPAAAAGVVIEATGVTLTGEGTLLTVSAPGVRVRGLRLRGAGGGAAGAPAVAVRGGGLRSDGLVVEGWPGPAVLVRGGALDGRLEVHGSAGPAVLALDGAQVHLQDSALRGAPSADLRPLALARGAGTRIALDRALLSGAAGGCAQAQAGADLRLRDSVVVGCGRGGAERPAWALAGTDGGTVRVEGGLVVGYGPDPHAHTRFGAVELDDRAQLHRDPQLIGLGRGEAHLVVSVDDTPNVDNAVALAPVMEARGLHLVFFANLLAVMRPAHWEGLRRLHGAGHEIGCHGATNGHLTQVEALALQAEAPGSWAEIDAEGRTLTLGGPGGPTHHLDLRAPAHDMIGELCAVIDAQPGHRCAPLASDSGSTPIFAASLGLASGRWALDGAGAALPWDRRLPSAGGRHFGHELTAVAEGLRAGLGDPAVCSAFAYPGQQHDAVARAAVADAGFLIARGAAAPTRGHSQLGRPADLWQTPNALTTEQVQGAGYADLSLDGRRARVTAWAQAWSAWALDVGAMGALTIHGEETLNAQELGWLLDGLSPAVEVQTMQGLLGDLRAAHGLPTPDEGAVDCPAAGSPLVDAGDPALGLGPDPWGTPRYGAPDLGPCERRPAHALGVDTPPASGGARFYADGRFDQAAAAGTPGPLRGALRPLEPTRLGPEAPRALVGALQLDAQADGAALQVALPAPACLALEAEAGAWVLTAGAGGPPLGLLRGAGAARLPAGATTLIARPARPGEARLPPLPGCDDPAVAAR
ncbi:MAG: hypothetical protein RL071_3112 [Pseudomonadota bacterium]